MPRKFAKTAGLDYRIVGLIGGVIEVEINGARYKYQSSLPGDRGSRALFKKVVYIAVRSAGKSLNCLKKNSTLVE